MARTPRRRSQPGLPRASGRTTAPRERRRNWNWAILGAVLLTVGSGVVLLITADLSGVGDIPGVVTFRTPSSTDPLPPVRDGQPPPVGGAHDRVWQNCGVYDQPVPVVRAMHSLEHGAVWITYRPDLPQSRVAQLRSFVRQREQTLLSPYPGLPTPIVATAWSVQLKLGSADDPRLALFIAKYVRGPRAPERYQSCTGGNGAPLAR